MNKLILIGNGFDLAHGLETKYNDFILWYLNNALSSLTDRVIYEDKLLKIKSNNTFKFIPIINSIKEFRSFISDYGVICLYKFPFLRDVISAGKDYGWVDIESEYYSALIKIFKKLEIKNLDKDPNTDKELQDLNTCFDLIKEKLEEYLSTIDGNQKIDKEISEQFSNILRPLSSAEDIADRRQMLFLNFNYTSTVELYIKNSLNNCRINYIHGKLNDENNPIIFGYGDEMDAYYSKIERLNDNNFLNHFKSFGYFKTNNYQNFSGFINSEKFAVYIMGHSCGLSDRILLNSIFEHPNCMWIEIYYYQKDEVKNDFFEKTQEISRHFTVTGKSNMRNMIVPFPNCVPLKKYKKS